MKIAVEGLDEIIKTLRTLQDKVVKPALRKAMREADKHMLSIAKDLAPVATGALKAALKVRAGKRKKDFIRLNIVSFSTGHLNYIGAFQEYGTKKMKKHPFIAPAFQRGQSQAQEIIRNSLNAALSALEK